MIDPEVGDYVVAKDRIYEITRVNKVAAAATMYTVRPIDNPADSLETDLYAKVGDELFHTMNLSRLRHLGEIVRKEEASKAIEVLFKNS